MQTMRALGDSPAAAEVRQRHRDFFLFLVEEAERGMRSAQQRAWTETLKGNFENLVTAFEWSLDRGEVDASLRLAAALALFADDRPPYTARLRDMLERALAAGGSDGPRSRALTSLAVLRSAPTLKFTPQEQQEVHDAAVAAARASGDRALEARALAGLGGARTDWRWHPRNRAVLEEALAIARQVGDQILEADIVYAVASAAKELGEEALSLFDEAIARFRALGDDWWVAWALYEVASFEFQLGRGRDHARHLEEMWATAKRINEPLVAACAADSLCAYAADIGDFARARTLLRGALEIDRSSGSPSYENWLLSDLGWMLLTSEDDAGARAAFEEAAALRTVWTDGDADLGLALLAQHSGDAAEAARRAERGVAAARVTSYWSPGDALITAAYLALAQRRFDDAAAMLDEAWDLRRHHMPFYELYWRAAKGQLLRACGDLVGAAEELERAADGFGDRNRQFSAISPLVRVRIEQGDLERARALLARALEGAVEEGRTRRAVLLFVDVARLAMVRGDEARARALVGGAAALRKRFGWRVPLHCADDHRATEELVGPVGDDVPTALDDVVAVAREVLADG